MAVYEIANPPAGCSRGFCVTECNTAKQALAATPISLTLVDKRATRDYDDVWLVTYTMATTPNPRPDPDRAAFLRAICDKPDDDLPRLVFADWLDEHSEPERAELIRVQVELAKIVGPYDAANYLPPVDGAGRLTWCESPECLYPASPATWCGSHRLLSREQDILFRDCPLPETGGDSYWFMVEVSKAAGLPSRPLAPDVPGRAWVEYQHQWTRGFVSAVTLPAADFSRHASALFNVTPLSEVTLTDANNQPPTFTAGDPSVTTIGRVRLIHGDTTTSILRLETDDVAIEVREVVWGMDSVEVPLTVGRNSADEPFAPFSFTRATSRVTIRFGDRLPVQPARRPQPLGIINAPQRAPMPIAGNPLAALRRGRARRYS